VLNEILATGVQSRVIVMSGYGDNYLRMAEGLAVFHNSDNASVLRKPFRCDDLVNLLQNVPDCARPEATKPRISAMSIT
jgi:hypothetical protein